MNPDSVTFHYTYVLRSKNNGQWYVGCTNDLRKRFNQHNVGQSPYTSHRGPYELIYYEAYRDAHDAHKREMQLKSGQGKAYLRSRLKRFLTLSG